MDTRKILFVVASALLAAAAAYWGWQLLKPAPQKPTPQQLAETALDKSAPPERRVEAAAELGQYSSSEAPSAPQEISRVYSQSSEPEVKSQMIIGMVSDLRPESFDSMETFFAAMNDDNLLIRARAHGAVKRLLQAEFIGYDVQEPSSAKRLAAIEKYREEWGRLRRSVRLQEFKERLKQESEPAGGPD